MHDRNLEAVSDLIWDTTTSDVRYYLIEQKERVRESVTLESPCGPPKAMQVKTPFEKARIRSEYEAIQKLSKQARIGTIRLKQYIVNRLD